MDRMRTPITLILLIVLAGFQAHAERNQGCNGHTVSVPNNLSLVCSATWQFSGKCNGEDLWDKWTVTGRTILRILSFVLLKMCQLL